VSGQYGGKEGGGFFAVMGDASTEPTLAGGGGRVCRPQRPNSTSR